VRVPSQPAIKTVGEVDSRWPLGKFGKVQGTGGSVKTAVQAVKGMAQTLGAIVKQAVTGDGASESKP